MMPLYENPQLVDLYQLTMVQSYLDHDMEKMAVFEFFVRKLPPKRNFLLAAGLDPLVEFIQNIHFSPEDLAYLTGCGFFRKNLINYLKNFRFTGDIDALPEGTVFFANEPVVRITAPLPQAQLIETRLINLLQFPILATTKAARCRLAADEKLLVDFGLRRAHGAEAGLAAARSAYIGGFNGTSNILAGQIYGIPVYGTMAHSYIQAHDSEMEAFRNFAQSQPENLVLLIDTYDTYRGAERVIELVKEIKNKGIQIKAVRIDSGDLGEESTRIRNLLDRSGCSDIGIFVSSSVDEYMLEHLQQQKAPIIGYGVGTSLATSEDAPYLNCAYKLQEYNGIPRMKLSKGKVTWPGRKQVYRYLNDKGLLDYDLLCPVTESLDYGERLLQPVMRHGRRVNDPECLDTIRNRVQKQLLMLTPELADLHKHTTFEPRIAQSLQLLAHETEVRFNFWGL